MSRFWLRQNGLISRRRPGREIAAWAWRARWRPAPART